MGMVGPFFLTISHLLRENALAGSTALRPTTKWRPFILHYYTLKNYCTYCTVRKLHYDALIIRY